MRRREFWKVVLASSLISSGLVLFALRWPFPPASRAGFVEPAIPALNTPLSPDESINIQVYEAFSRGVVNVTVTTIELSWFFQAVPREGSGSGVVLDRAGHVLTNNHVIEGAERIDVTLYDQSKYAARVVGVDPVNDLAVVSIEAPEASYHPIKVGSSEGLKVGQKVLAIGNPFGLERTLTTGIISSLGRTLQTRSGYIIDDVIQTDAAINPGNSGGPLLNTRGEMIGINTAIFSSSGESVGIGFAVPAATIARVVPDLIEHGEVIRPWFGVRGQSLFPQLARALELPVEEGLLVERVEPGSSADQAGIRGGDRQGYFGNFRLIIGGDVLVSLAGKPVASTQDILRILGSGRPGDRVEAVFYRGERRIEKTIELVGSQGRRRFRF